MEKESGRCPLCDRVFLSHPDATSGDWLLDCPGCGRFRISGGAIELLQPGGVRRSLAPFVSAHTRQAAERGEVALVTESNCESLARSHQNTGVPRKIRKLLEALARRTTFAGEFVSLDPDNDYPLTDSVEAEEVRFIARHLVDDKLLWWDNAGGTAQLTVEGWARLMPNDPGGVPGTCFVAMSFDDALDSVFDDGIRPAVEDDCGFTVIRLDRIEHNENINDRIMADVRAAQFMVADFTGHKKGVYFEAGFALGLGRSVIWTCRAADFDDRHFDTRPYNHIVWTTPAELREKLTARIRATIPNTPKKLGTG